jgi:hypothetical protein
VTNFKQTVLLFNQVRNTSTILVSGFATGPGSLLIIICYVQRRTEGGGDKDDSKKIKGNAFFVHPIVK